MVTEWYVRIFFRPLPENLNTMEGKENKKRWGAEKARLGWQQNSGIFGLDKVKNPYGDIGNPLQGDGVYLKMMMQKKMIVKAKPGESAL